MGQQRGRGGGPEERASADARIRLRLTTGCRAGTIKDGHKDERPHDRHGARLDRRLIKCRRGRAWNHVRLAMGRPEPARAWNLEGCQSSRPQAVEAILDGLSRRPGASGRRRDLPHVSALSGDGDSSQENRHQTCFLTTAHLTRDLSWTDLLSDQAPKVFDFWKRPQERWISHVERPML